MYQRRKGRGRTRNRKRRKNPRKRRLSKKRQNQIRKPGSRWLFLARGAQKKNTDEIILHVRGHPGYCDKESLDKGVNKGLPFTVIYRQLCPLCFLSFYPLPTRVSHQIEVFILALPNLAVREMSSKFAVRILK